MGNLVDVNTLRVKRITSPRPVISLLPSLLNNFFGVDKIQKARKGTSVRPLFPTLYKTSNIDDERDLVFELISSV